MNRIIKIRIDDEGKEVKTPIVLFNHPHGFYVLLYLDLFSKEIEKVEKGTVTEFHCDFL